MMIEQFGKHATYILSAYSVAFVILAAMVVFSLLKARFATKRLETLKNAGIFIRDETEHNEPSS